MPFGLSNAPATFQRLMDLVLAGMQYQECLVYPDDVIVFSAAFEEHMVRLGSVLDRLADAGLKSSKCHLCCQEVHYLGPVVSSRGLQPDPGKVSAVRIYPVPIDVSQLRSFLSLAGYYRRFTCGFSQLAAPLFALLEKGNLSCE